MLSDLNVPNHQSDTEDAFNSITSHQVQDVEELNQVLQGIGYFMIQMSTNPCYGEVRAIRMRGLSLFRVIVHCSVYTEMRKSSNNTVFSIVLKPTRGNIINHKMAFPIHSSFVFGPNHKHGLITPEQLDLAIIVFSSTQFQKCLHELERDDLDQHFFKQNYIQTANDVHYALQTYLQQTFHLASTNPNLLERSQKLLKDDLLSLLINCFNTGDSSGAQIHPFRRSVIVKQAEDFIMTHLNQPLTLQDLCKSVGASKSALSYGFQEIFGMSPMAYLKIRRLNGVRHALKQSNPQTDTVLRIANRYGFWHMGHFSQDYKQMFGELPTETLRDLDVRQCSNTVSESTTKQ